MNFSKITAGVALIGATLFFTGCIQNDTPEEYGPTNSVMGAANDPSSIDYGTNNVDNFDAVPGGDVDGFITGADNVDALGTGAADGSGWTPITDGPDFPIIYFGFDQDTISAESMLSIEQVASYMAEYPELGLIVEGHTDDVGTNEYNRALGERRAIAIMDALGTYGLGAERISTISYGEDVPAENGTDSAARAANRRGVLLPASME